MGKSSLFYFALGTGALFLSLGATAVQAQSYPMVDKLAAKVIQKYETSTCQQIAADKIAPPNPKAGRVKQLLQQNPEMRTYFINKVAGPVANKLFECGMLN